MGKGKGKAQAKAKATFTGTNFAGLYEWSKDENMTFTVTQDGSKITITDRDNKVVMRGKVKGDFMEVDLNGEDIEGRLHNGKNIVWTNGVAWCPHTPKVKEEPMYYETESADKAAERKAKAEEALETVTEEFKESVLKAHNDIRCETFPDENGVDYHLRPGVVPINWSDECYIAAKIHADYLHAESGGQVKGGNCDGPSGRHGQTLYMWEKGKTHASDAPTVIRHQWCARANDNSSTGGYDYSSNCSTIDAFPEFTQVVWKDTTSVGVAVSGDFLVANYFPEGNIRGLYHSNVAAKEYKGLGNTNLNLTATHDDEMKMLAEARRAGNV